MGEDIRLVKEDLAVILKLDQRLDYSGQDGIKKYYEQLAQANMLTTSLGQKYMRKLEQIIDGDESYAHCLFCAGETSKDTVICASCMAKLKNLSAGDGKTDAGEAFKAGSEADAGEAFKTGSEADASGLGQTQAEAAAELLSQISASGRKIMSLAAAAALIVLCALCCLIGGFLHHRAYANSNIINYLGATEKAVQRRNDESRFLDILFDSEEHITTVWLRSDLVPAFHVNGLHIGDGKKQVEKCMEKLDAELLSETELRGDTLFLQYAFRYNRKKVLAGITLKEGQVSDIIITCQ